MPPFIFRKTGRGRDIQFFRFATLGNLKISLDRVLVMF